MGRIRSVHPEQWTDDQFVTSSPLARLIALGVRNEADDNGIFEWNPVKLKMRLLPADNADIGALMSELLETKQVMRYEVNEKSYGMIKNFQKYQKPKKPTFYYPIPTEPLPNGYELNPSYFPTSSPPVPHQFGKSSSDGKGKGKGEEGLGSKRKTPLPPTFGVSDRVRKWAENHGHRELDRHLEAFKTKATAHGYKYVDWDSAFMEAVRGNWANIATDIVKVDL